MSLLLSLGLFVGKCHSLTGMCFLQYLTEHKLEATTTSFTSLEDQEFERMRKEHIHRQQERERQRNEEEMKELENKKLVLNQERNSCFCRVKAYDSSSSFCCGQKPIV